MKAIVLAAGFSTRLYPLTKHFPKALLPVGNKALIDYMLDDLFQQPEISDIALVTNQQYQLLFETWMKTYYPRKTVHMFANGIHDAKKRMGAIGDILYTLKKTEWINDDILILSSDTLTSMSLSKFIHFFQSRRGVVNGIYDTKDRSVIKNRLGCVVMKGDKISEFIEKPKKPKTTLTSIPYYIYSKEALQLLTTYKNENGDLDAPGSIMSWFIGKIPVHGYKETGYYYDVGTLDTYNTVADKQF
ncbi:nucleotidyltransferase family protein [Patescibacteria group bacterium]